MYKRIVKNLWIVLLCTAIQIGCFGGGYRVSAASKAAVSSKVLKMCKGKWDRGSQDGINTHYCIFTSKYIKWYLNGKFDYKTKIVKVEKKSSKKYVFKLKNAGIKFRYIGRVKDGKFVGFDFYDGWSGTNGYSGSSSLGKI